MDNIGNSKIYQSLTSQIGLHNTFRNRKKEANSFDEIISNVYQKIQSTVSEASQASLDQIGSLRNRIKDLSEEIKAIKEIQKQYQVLSSKEFENIEDSLTTTLDLTLPEVKKLMDEKIPPILKINSLSQETLKETPLEEFRELSQELRRKDMDSYKSHKGNTYRLSNEVDKISNFIQSFESDERFQKINSQETIRFSRKDLKGFYENQEKAPNIPLLYDARKKRWFADKIQHLGSGSYKDVSLVVGISKRALLANATFKTSKCNAPEIQNIIHAEASIKKNFPRKTRGILSCKSVIQYPSSPSRTPLKKTGILSEFLNGGDLKNSIKKKTLQAKEKQKIAFDILYGCSAMSQKGLASRDIKPENIMLKRDDRGKIEAKHIDFGFMTQARNPGESRRICGTPKFMAPELLSRKTSLNEDMRKLDSYSLGLTLIKLIHGSTPKSLKMNLPKSGKSSPTKEYKIAVEKEMKRAGNERSNENVLNDTMEEIKNNIHLSGEEKAILSIAIKCLHPNPRSRPLPEEMIQELKNKKIPDPNAEKPGFLQRFNLFHEKKTIPLFPLDENGELTA